jgi:ribosomal protein S18 acetylase RimI-like enzyme
MFAGASQLPDGLSLRPETPGDSAFLARLYNERRDDLRLVDGSRDFVESLIGMQHTAQVEGYGSQFPNAMYLVVEKSGERIGRICLDFGPNEVRLVDVAFLAAARGRGYGTAVVKALQTAAAQVRAPLTLAVAINDPAAQRVYAALGFRVESTGPMHHHLVWYPTAATIAG